MKTVENGHTVTVHYKGTFTNGEIFDDSRSRGQAMDVLIGAGRIIPGFENALLGMSTGESKTVNLSVDEAYGPPNPEAITTVPKTVFPSDYDFQVGTRVQGQSPDGNTVLAKIVSFDDENVVLDHNHPLAGEDLNFEIEVLAIADVDIKNTPEADKITSEE